MPHLSRRTMIVTAIAAIAALLTGTGTGAAAAPAKPHPASKPAPGMPTAPAATTGTLPPNYAIVPSTPTTLAAGDYGFVSASCPSTRFILGGGGSNSAAGTVVLTDSAPTGSTGWGVWYKNNGTTAASISAWAICIA